MNNSNNSNFLDNFPVFGIVIPIISIIFWISGLGNILYYNGSIIFGNYEFWRILIYFVSVNEPITLIFQIFMCVIFSISEEKRMGSVKFIYNIFIHSLLVGIVSLPINAITFYLKVPLFIGIANSIGVPFFLYITLYCFKNPEDITPTMCCPPIKNKYFPLLWIAISSILQLKFNVIDISILLLSIWMVKAEQSFKFIYLKNSTVKKIENYINFMNCMGTVYYIRDDDENYQSAVNTIHSMNVNISPTYIKNENNNENEQKVNYFGGKGINLNENKTSSIDKEERKKKFLANLEKNKKEKEDKITSLLDNQNLDNINSNSNQNTEPKNVNLNKKNIDPVEKLA